MKTTKTVCLMTAALSAITIANASMLAVWENDHLSGTPASTVAGEAPSGGFMHPDLTEAIMTRGSNASTYTNAFAMRSGDEATLADAINANRYIAVTLTADDGLYFDSFSEFFVRLEANNIGDGRSVALFSSATGFSNGDQLWETPLAVQWTTHTIDLTGVSELQNNTDLNTVEFRIYNWGSSSQWNALAVGRGFQVNGTEDLRITGSISVIPEPSIFGLIGIGGLYVLYRRRRR